MVTTPVVTATGTLKRTVSDQIRRLNPVVTPLMSIIKDASTDEMGKQSYSSGLIGKEKSDTMKFEWFTYTPVDVYVTCTVAGTGTTVGLEVGTFQAADTNMFRTRDIVTNLSTLEVGVVNAASATTPTITCISATWTAAIGDVIAMSCRTVEEGTSDITPLTKEPDNNYNYCFPFRYSVSIADTAVNSPHYAEQPLQRYMTDNLTFTLRNAENALFLGKRAASGDTTTVTIGGTAYSMFTTRGILDYATSPIVVNGQNPIDGGGALTFDQFNTRVFENLPNTLNPSRTLLMFMGKRIFGRMKNWADQKLMQIDYGDVDEFGVRPTKFQCGAFTIKPMLHDLFDHGALQYQAVILDPDDIVYRFKTGMDIDTKDNLQLPATWGTTRAVQGVIGLQCISGGANVRQIINWNN
jgi:hypothetical protein